MSVFKPLVLMNTPHLFPTLIMTSSRLHFVADFVDLHWSDSKISVTLAEYKRIILSAVLKVLSAAGERRVELSRFLLKALRDARVCLKYSQQRETQLSVLLPGLESQDSLLASYLQRRL